MSKILIVEDEDAIRRVLKKVLSEENPKSIIEEAVDGVDAVAKIKANEYNLVICDIKMPKKDGIEVLNFIKVRSKFKTCKCYLVFDWAKLSFLFKILKCINSS